MLKRLFLAVVLTLALSFSAFAADNGFYLGLKFIDSIQSTGDVSKGGGTKFFDVDNYTQNTIGGGVFVPATTSTPCIRFLFGQKLNMPYEPIAKLIGT